MSLITLWVSVNDLHSVGMSIMRKLYSVFLMDCKGLFRLGYVARSLQTCSQLCKWLNRSAPLLPLLAKMTSVGQKKLLLCQLPLGNIGEMATHQWSLVPLQCSVANVMRVANTVTKLLSAPRAMRQLPTLCPTITMVPRASRMLNLVICSLSLGSCSLLLLI